MPPLARTHARARAHTSMYPMKKKSPPARQDRTAGTRAAQPRSAAARRPAAGAAAGRKAAAGGGRRIQVRRSGVHGKGVFALVPIAKGTRLIEYIGEVVTWPEALSRHPQDTGARPSNPTRRGRRPINVQARSPERSPTRKFCTGNPHRGATARAAVVLVTDSRSIRCRFTASG